MIAVGVIETGGEMSKVSEMRDRIRGLLKINEKPKCILMNKQDWNLFQEELNSTLRYGNIEIKNSFMGYQIEVRDIPETIIELE